MSVLVTSITALPPRAQYKDNNILKMIVPMSQDLKLDQDLLVSVGFAKKEVIFFSQSSIKPFSELRKS